MTSGPGSSGSRTGTGAGPGGYSSGSGSGGGSFGSGILHYPPRFIPDLVVAEIKTIRERVLWVSYGLFRASSVSHSILFHSVLFPSLQEFSTYAENAQSWSPQRNHEPHVFDCFPRIADSRSGGERKERQQNAEDHNQIPSSSLFRNAHSITVAGLPCCRY